MWSTFTELDRVALVRLMLAEAPLGGEPFPVGRDVEAGLELSLRKVEGIDGRPVIVAALEVAPWGSATPVRKSEHMLSEWREACAEVCGSESPFAFAVAERYFEQDIRGLTETHTVNGKTAWVEVAAEVNRRLGEDAAPRLATANDLARVHRQRGEAIRADRLLRLLRGLDHDARMERERATLPFREERFRERMAYLDFTEDETAGWLATARANRAAGREPFPADQPVTGERLRARFRTRANRAAKT